MRYFQQFALLFAMLSDMAINAIQQSTKFPIKSRTWHTATNPIEQILTIAESLISIRGCFYISGQHTASGTSCLMPTLCYDFS